MCSFKNISSVLVTLKSEAVDKLLIQSSNKRQISKKKNQNNNNIVVSNEATEEKFVCVEYSHNTQRGLRVTVSLTSL